MPVLNNLIGGKHKISDEGGGLYALSLVRKFKKDHAYLILEGVINGERVVNEAHLVTYDEKKAAIETPKLNMKSKKTVEYLNKIGKSCSCFTWNISHAQATKFLELVNAEMEKDINYVLPGSTPISGIFASSNPEDKKMDSVSVDSLARKGHNCCSWAIAMIETMGLTFTKSWFSFIAVVPHLEVRGQHNADDKHEPTSSCLIM